MVDSKNNPNNYKIVKISTGTIMKYREMLRFVPEHLKTKKISKNTVKKLPFLIKYVPDQYKTKEICDKVIIETCDMLWFVTRIKKCVIKKLEIIIIIKFLYHAFFDPCICP